MLNVCRIWNFFVGIPYNNNEHISDRYKSISIKKGGVK